MRQVCFFSLLLSNDFWAVRNGHMNHFQHFLSLLLKVALYTERVLTSISAQKPLSLAGVINWAFLKGQRRLGETKDGVHRVYQTVLWLANLQPYWCLKLVLLFNIAHKIAWAPLCIQLVLVHPHMNVSKDFGLSNKNVQYNDRNPVLTSSASISWFFWIPP